MNTVTIPGYGDIHYEDAGDPAGRPVVFIHGLLVDGTLWRKVVPLLEAEHRCITPTLPLGSHTTPMQPGADLSPNGLAALIAGFLEALDLHDAVLVGNDTGGALTQITVARHPERIGAVVLTNCDAYENFLPPAFRPLQWLARIPGFVGTIAQAMRSGALRRSPLAFGLLSRTSIPDDVTGRWAAPLIANKGTRRDVAKVLVAIKPRYLLDAMPGLHAFDGPAHIVWAEKDRFFKLATAHRLVAEFRHGTLTTLDDALTFVSEDRPDAVAQAVAGLRRTPAVA